MTHTTRDYATRIRQSGFRLTPQRQLILDAVCEGGGHTTFEAICARVQAKAPSINRSTVYRNLEFLQRLHLVVAAEIDGETVYEIAREQHHHHLVCRDCGRQIEIGEATLASAFAAILQEYDFLVMADHLVLGGLCGACRTATE
jgi:Fe2+ or Zn2+ uptake regulation protein